MSVNNKVTVGTFRKRKAAGEKISMLTVYDAPGTMDIGNAPVTNVKKRSYGKITLEQAMWYSSNTVFGQVYDGMDVVDAIAAVECGEDDRPLEDVIVNSVTIGTYSAAQSGSTPASGASGSDSAA